MEEPAEETEAAAPDTGGGGSTPADRAEIPSIDLTGWRVEDIEWTPVWGGCCGTQIVGTPSPPWPDEPFDWPDDGWYAASVEHRPDDLTSVRLGLARWVFCTERPDLCVGEYPVEGHEDDGVAIDPDTSIERTVPIDELAVTISHVHRPFSIAGRESEETWAVHGEPGAFGTLLTDVLDPLYETWVVPLLDEDTPVERVVEQLVAGADDPGHPFGIFPLVDHSYDPEATFVAFRGPFGFTIELTEVIGRRENPARGSTSRTYTDYDLRTSGLNDLYAGELRMRDGRPILHLESGTPTWG